MSKVTTDAGQELIRQTYGMKVRRREDFVALESAILAIEREAAAMAIEVVRTRIVALAIDSDWWRDSVLALLDAVPPR